jgi:hypothetical protein
MEEEQQQSYGKTYYKTNKDSIIERNKQYRQTNAEKIKESYKKYWELNGTNIKAKRKEKIKCELCNCEVTRESFTNHKKSKLHLENINKLNSNENV